MNIVLRKWLKVAAVVALALLAAGWGFVSRMNGCQIQKIDFILADNQRSDGIGHLSRGEMVDYLKACRAVVDASQPVWKVRYAGWCRQKEWDFRFVVPKGEKEAL